ncbi:DUF72 domain-containing protein [Pelagibaculum spongiae]|nr:DUF72 domain-containing protein [Pelagibaculum spongiae]
MWQHSQWDGSLCSPGIHQQKMLYEYSRAFNSVEGNTTFYATPTKERVKGWADLTPTGFQFCFKFPQQITHHLMLAGSQRETEQFLDVMGTIEDRLGSFLIQLPPGFSPQQIDLLAGYLDRLPKSFRYAVEVRHLRFFTNTNDSHLLDQTLSSRGIDRVCFDSRALFSMPAELAKADLLIADAFAKKPRLPVKPRAIAKRPMVRLIGLLTPQQNLPWLEQWADKFALWITQGRQPYIFLHTPDNRLAPQMCREFHKLLQQRLPQLAALPEWPGEGFPSQQGLL